MARDDTTPQRPPFGRPDPFCWVAVVAMLGLAVVFILGGVAIVGIIVIVLAILVILYDSWVNRPDPRDAAPPRHPAPAATRAPQRHPAGRSAQQRRPTSRAPQRRRD